MTHVAVFNSPQTSSQPDPRPQIARPLQNFQCHCSPLQLAALGGPAPLRGSVRHLCHCNFILGLTTPTIPLALPSQAPNSAPKSLSALRGTSPPQVPPPLADVPLQVPSAQGCILCLHMVPMSSLPPPADDEFPRAPQGLPRDLAHQTFAEWLVG